MATTYEPQHLSASSNGGVINISDPNVYIIVHTAPSATNIYDEVYLNLYYFGASATGVAEVIIGSILDQPMQFHLVSGTVTPILRGHRISNGATVSARNATGGTMLCFGTVNRITII